MKMDKLLLLLLRAGFISMGEGNGLTEKGRGCLPESFWVRYIKVRSKFDLKFRKDVVGMLASAKPHEEAKE